MTVNDLILYLTMVQSLRGPDTEIFFDDDESGPSPLLVVVDKKSGVVSISSSIYNQSDKEVFGPD